MAKVYATYKVAFTVGVIDPKALVKAAQQADPELAAEINTVHEALLTLMGATCVPVDCGFEIINATCK